MTQKRLYQVVIILGLLPTIAVFIWGINLARQTKAEHIAPWFSQMQ